MANFAPVKRELTGLVSQFNQLDAVMQATATSTAANGNKMVDGNLIRAYQSGISGIAQNFREAVTAQGDYEVQTHRVQSSTADLTDRLQKQSLGLRDVIKNRKELGEVYKRQIALQKATAVSWSRNADGTTTADLIIPKNIDSALKGVGSLRSRMGMYNTVLASVADNTVKWGKNTQWAGRQLMAGISMPMGIAAAGAARMAYQVDKGLTQIVKVYGATGEAVKETDQQIKDATMATARDMAKGIGQSVNDTLEITSALASTGKTGQELQDSAKAVSRARVLGELNTQDAMSATITLQEAYGMDALALGDAFNYLNAMENETSLTMQDFVTAIPKTAGVMKALNADLQDTGILMTAMKSAGIDAAEGANAIKSIVFKAAAPSGTAEKSFLELTGKSLRSISEEANGEVIPTLQAIAKAMEGLSDVEKTRVGAKTFGIYQGSKALGMLEMLNEESGQVATAMKLATAATEDLAATADRELEKLTSSKWNKFQQQWELFKISITDVGMAVLEATTPLLKWVNGVIEWGKGLSSTTKSVLKWSALIAATSGVVIMFGGLMMNMMGNFAKGLVFLGRVIGKFSVVNEQQRIAQLVSTKAAAGLNTEAAAANILATQLGKAANALDTLTGAELRAQAVSGLPASTVGRQRGPNGQFLKKKPSRQRGPNGQFLPSPENAALNAAADKLDDATKSAAKNSAAVKRNISGSATGALGIVSMAAALGMAATDSGVIMNSLLTAAMVAPMLTPLFVGMRNNFKIDKGTKTGFAGMKAGLKGLIGGVGLLSAGWVAMGAAAALALYATNKRINRTRDEARALQDVTESLAKINGATYEPLGQGEVKDGKEVLTYAQKLAKVSEDQRNALRGVKGEQEQLNEVMRIGYEAVNHGVSPEQAAETARMAYDLMDNELTREQIETRVQVAFFESESNTLSALVSAATRDAERAVNGTVEEGLVHRMLLGRNEIGPAARELIQRDAEELGNAWLAANEAGQERISKQIAKSQEGLLDSYFPKAKDLDKSGIMDDVNDVTEFRSLIMDSLNEDADQRALNFSSMGLNVEDSAALVRLTETMKETYKTLARIQGLDEGTPEFIEFMKNADDLLNPMAKVQNAEEAYERQIKTRIALGVRSNESMLVQGEVMDGLEDSQKLAILNYHRVSAGLERTTNLADGFNTKVTEISEATEKNAKSTKKATDQLDNWKKAFSDWGLDRAKPEELTETLKTINSEAMEEVYDEAERLMEQQEENAIASVERWGEGRKAAMEREREASEKNFDRLSDNLDAKNEKREKTFESRWDGIMDRLDVSFEKRRESIESSYDARINAVERQIKVEQNAEEIRQRIFEAEKSRIQRLSEMYNKNIDINAAITTGNLDEAAKLTNDSISTQSGWASDDSEAAAGRASQQRVSVLENQIKGIEKGKNARLEALEEVEKAEKAALEAKRVREKTALDAETKRYERALEAQKNAADKSFDVQEKSLDNQIDSKRTAEQKKYELAKRSIQKEMDVLRKSTPRTRAEMNAHMTKMRKIYGDYGVDLTKRGDYWAKIMGNALTHSVKKSMTEMADTKRWERLGAAAAKAMAKGSFGMSMSSFMKWVETGEAPAGWTPEKAAGGKSKHNGFYGSGGSDKGRSIIESRHSGGIVGSGPGSRVGYSGQYNSPSEVNIRALKGEAVLNRRATRTLGADFVSDANEGKLGGLNSVNKRRQQGDGIGIPSIALGGMMRAAMQAGMARAAQSRLSMDSGVTGDFSAVAGKPGVYGNTALTAEQLRNAATISATGKGLGATTRDIMIAIMTALQESSLRAINYGDRDSLGLFQQRAPWGSAADRIDPRKSTEMFFKGGAAAGTNGLFSKTNRTKMSMAEAAQSVQASAYPGLYAKWEDEARDIVKSLTFSSSGGSGGPGGAKKGVWEGMGWQRQWDIVKSRFPDATLTSAYRPGSITSSGNPSMHGIGRAIDIGYSMTSAGKTKMNDVFEWLRAAYGSKSSELIWSAAGGRQIKDGKNLLYGPDVKANHWNHVHWAMRNGGKVPGRGRGDITPIKAEPGEYVINRKIVNRVGPSAFDSLNAGKISDFVLQTGLGSLAKMPTLAGMTTGMDNASSTVYNVRMDLNGATFAGDHAPADFQRAVERALVNVDKRVGQSRRVG